MIRLELNLPSMSEVVAERRRADAARRARSSRRTYQAAQINRLTSDWSTSQTSANSELRQSLRNLRARSRELARNNDYIKKFLSMVVSNVVGPKGVTLQVKAKTTAGQPDTQLNTLVEEQFKDWSRKQNASASGKLSWRDCQRLFIRSVARDGEVLVRKVIARNPHGFALKFISPTWLDETYNTILASGNRVLMSVEVDENDRPVAYHLTPPTTDYLYGEYPTARERQRVPAEEIIHAYLVIEEEAQTRATPWAHTAMLRLQIFGGYEEAEVVAARGGACKGGFLTPPEDDEDGGLQEDPDQPQQVFESVEPGMLQVLPPGYKFDKYDPDHPNANYQGFQKTVLRGVASGLDVSYFTLAQDLEAVNYSSARIGLLDERDIWRALQWWMIDHFCEEVFKAWAEHSMLSGALPITLSQLERIKNPCWRPRGWSWVDPAKDIAASVVAINNGLTTRTAVIAESGEDFEEVVAQLEAEQKLLKEKGIVLNTQGLAELSAMVAAESSDSSSNTP